jgi:hypothetical protein
MKAFPGSRWWQKPFPGCVVDRDGEIPPPSCLFLLNENGGLTAYDIAGGNSGTLDATTMWNWGKFGAGINCAGSKKVTVGSPNKNVNQLTFNSGLASWVWWAYRGTAASGQGPFFYKSNGNLSSGWFSYIDASNFHQFQVVAGGANLVNKSSVASTQSVWNQYAAVFNGPVTATASLTLYLNGLAGTTSVAIGSGTAADDSASPLYFGSSNAGAGPSPNVFDGVLDHVAFWKGTALTAAQVARLYWDPFAYILKAGTRRIYTPGIVGSAGSHSFPLLHCGA